MRALTITPTDDGWVALPPGAIATKDGMPYRPIEPWVLGLVERCKTCTLTFAGRLIHNPHCLDCNGTGHLHVGFVRVVEVLPIVAGPNDGANRWPDVDVVSYWKWTNSGPDKVALHRYNGNRTWEHQDITLPDATPGGVALRVEVLDALWNGDWLSLPSDLPEFGPVTVIGTGPIVEVAP